MRSIRKVKLAVESMGGRRAWGSSLVFAASLALTLMGEAEAGEARPRVLVLLSYSASFPTTEPILRTLRDHLDVRMDVEFLDTKSAWSPAYAQSSQDVLSARLAKRPPYALVLSADDSALDLLVRDAGRVVDAPVIAFGINALDRWDGLSEDRYRVLEELPDVAGTLELARDLAPDLKKVVAIVDGSRTSDDDLGRLRREVDADILEVWSLAEGLVPLVDRARGLGPETAIVVLSAHRGIGGVVLDFGETVDELCGAAGAPCYTLWEHGLRPSVLGGSVVSLANHARAAADLGSIFLAGRPFASLPEAPQVPHRRIVRRDVARRWPELFERLPMQAPWRAIIATAFAAAILLATQLVARRRRGRAPEPSGDKAADLAAVGMVTASIAHDLNNVLQVVRTYGSLLEESNLPAEVKEDLLAMRQASEVGGKLTRRLLAWTRGPTGATETVVLADHVAQLRGLLEKLLHGELVLIPVPDPDLYTIQIDPIGLDQILLNLVSNARDAGASLVEVDVRGVVTEAPFPTLGGQLEPGAWVVLEVADNGEGIPEGNLDKLTRAFFTSRKARGGTGLGLATVDEQVRAAGGGIQVESSLGVGTTFRIYLPQVEAKGAQARARADAVRRRRALTGSGQVGIADADPNTRLLLARVVERYGYEAFGWSSGEELLERLHAGFEPVVAVVDPTLRTGSGRSVLEVLRESYPELSLVQVLDAPLGQAVDPPAVARPVEAIDLLVAMQAARGMITDDILTT